MTSSLSNKAAIDVIVLAGGAGTRLGSLTSELPKPMLPVHSRPFLEYLIASLRKQIAGRIVISAGHLGEVIVRNFEAHDHVEVVCESMPLGTGGAIKHAYSAIQTEDVIVVNGDTMLRGIEYVDFLATSRNSLVNTRVVCVRESGRRYGSILVDPTTGNIGSLGMARYTNAGVYWLRSRRVLDICPIVFGIEDYFEEIGANAYLPHDLETANFIDIGVPEDYRRFINSHRDFADA